MPFDLLLFDLDGTLYDQACGYEENIHSNIFRFMVQATGPDWDEIQTIEQAKAVWKPIFDKYNLTKRGFIGEGFDFDPEAYDRFIRQGVEDYIPPNDVELRDFLVALPQRKLIVTNAPEFSAHEILKHLGVHDLFDAVLGSDFFGSELCKPECAAFDKVLDFCGRRIQDPVTGSMSIVHPERICFFEDSFKNMLAGKELGFATVFVSCATLANEGQSQRSALEQFDAVIDGKADKRLFQQLPSLLEMPRPDPIDVLVFDLDGTLYDRRNGFMNQMRKNVSQFMVDCRGGKMEEIQTIEQAEAARRPLFAKYNQTKRGLQLEGYEFDGDAYDEALRRGASEFFSELDQELVELLQSLPQRKVVFTNGPEQGSRSILEGLGILHLFDGILGSEFCDQHSRHGGTCKPEAESFQLLLEYLHVPPERICFFEDSVMNLKAGRDLGMATVLIASDTARDEGHGKAETLGFDAVLEHKVNASLRTKLPYLWLVQSQGE
eukprot:Nitzschia sp. Nitz4//scaffold34_size148208//40835//42310//NITZ4_002971-RA/size148208-processed-gene-0.40-mRNA-1//1//CDS//3329548768//3714//frame0